MFLAACLSHGVLHSFILFRKGFFSRARSASINMKYIYIYIYIFLL